MRDGERKEINEGRGKSGRWGEEKNLKSGGEKVDGERRETKVGREEREVGRGKKETKMEGERKWEMGRLN